MIKLIQSGPDGGDATVPYSVVLEKKCTVKEFADAVRFECPGEWGSITVIVSGEDISFLECQRVLNYAYGKEQENFIPNEIMQKEVLSVTAAGGWSRMDYYVVAKDET